MKVLISSLSLARLTLVFLLLAVNVSCDQISKSYVRQHINGLRPIEVIDRHVTVTRVENTGAFLSAGSDLPQPLRYILLTIFPIVMLTAAIGYVLFKNDLSKLATLGICCFIGGGIGNLYDRFMHGSVTDFLHIDFGTIETGIFNIADLSITAGVMIIIIEMFAGKISSQELNS